MKARKLYCGLIVSLMCVHSAFAYETHTHAYITFHAYNASIIGGTAADSHALQARLGLDRLSADEPFIPYWLPVSSEESAYYDNAPTDPNPQAFLRVVGAHEWAQMRKLADEGHLGSDPYAVAGITPIQTLPIVNWLMRGVILEDQLKPGTIDLRMDHCLILTRGATFGVCSTIFTIRFMM